MYIDKDLIEDKLYELTDQFSVRKLTLQILILYYLTIYAKFMMPMEGLVRYCLLAISI